MFNDVFDHKSLLVNFEDLVPDLPILSIVSHKLSHKLSHFTQTGKQNSQLILSLECHMVSMYFSCSS